MINPSLLFIKKVTQHSLIFLIVLFIVRLFFFGSLVFYNRFHEVPLSTAIAHGLNFDYLLTSAFLPLFAVLTLFHKWGEKSILFLISVFTIFNVFLYGYELVNFRLLGSEILSYSLSEIIFIAISGFEDILQVLVFLMGVGITFCAIYYIKKSLNKWKKPKRVYFDIIILLVFIIGTTQIIYINPRKSQFQNALLYQYAHNPTAYLGEQLVHYHQNKKPVNEKELMQAVQGFQTFNTHFQYVNKNFPFLRKYESYNSLDTLFHLNEKPPHVVIVIVESLSRCFSGPNAYLGSFTPFLDSLVNHSLYWTNFYSNCHRTFNAIPNILSSTPIGGDRGVMMLPLIPDHLSLLDLMEKNGYTKRFVYGGDSHFDDTKKYLMQKGVSEIIGINDFIYFSGEKSTWGQLDENLMKEYLARKKAASPTRTNLDILLTLSIHLPFDQAPISLNKTLKNRLNTLDRSDSTKKIIQQNAPLFRNVLYTDQCLQTLINGYKKHEDFANTIFIITGDHRSDGLPLRNELDQFHVPLLIYSPLLKKAASFEFISSHLDIPVSLWSLLSEKYQFKNPEHVSWLGSGLRVKQENIPYYTPLMNVNGVGQGIYQNQFMVDGNVKQIHDGKLSKSTNNPAFKKATKAYFLLNKYVCENNKLSKL